jgi:hypothetical protein
MSSRRGRIVTLAVGVVGLVAVSAGVADAAPTTLHYRTNYMGPISDQATCEARSAVLNDPPDVLTTSCYYSATFPNTTTSDAGWYFLLRYLID